MQSWRLTTLRVTFGLSLSTKGVWRLDHIFIINKKFQKKMVNKIRDGVICEEKDTEDDYA